MARRPARTNVRLLIILLSGTLVLGAGLVSAYFLRQQWITAAALRDGSAAFERGEWPSAVRNLRRYLSKNPRDAEVIEKVGEAYARYAPLTEDSVRSAIQFLRHASLLRGGDPRLDARLANIYTSIGESGELASLAKRRLEKQPDDAAGTLWAARALLLQRKNDEARALLTPLLQRLADQPKSREVLDAHMLLYAIESNTSAEAALQRLDAAIAYDFEPTEALLARARLLRSGALRGQSREAAAELALADLKRADQIGSSDPRVLLTLAQEWLDQGDSQASAAALQKVRALSLEQRRAYMLDPLDADVAIFLVEAKRAVRDGQIQRGVELADAALQEFQQAAHRAAVLPIAVDLYNHAEARKSARAALDEYRKLVGRDATLSERADLLEAVVLRGEGRHQDAIRLLEPITRRGSTNATAWRLIGFSYRDVNQARRAAAALSRALELSPFDAQVAYELLAALRACGDWTAAHDLASKLESAAPQPRMTLALQAALEMAQSAESGAARAVAAQVLQEIEQLVPPEDLQPAHAVLRARALLATNRAAEAEQQLRSALSKMPDALEVAAELARVLGGSQRIDEGAAVLRSIAQRKPELAGPWLALGEYLQLAGRADEARQVLAEARPAIQDAPEQNNMDMVIALLDARGGRPQEAELRLRALAEREPADLPSRLLLFQLALAGPDAARAQALVDQIKQIEGEAGLNWRYCQAALLLGASDGAARGNEVETLLNYCLDADPEWAAPALMLAALREREGKLVDAEAAYRRALAIQPDSVTAANRLSSLYARQRRFADAKDVLDRLPAHDQRSRAARLDVALQERDFPRAIEELKLLSAGDPRDLQARLTLAQLVYAQQRDLPRALKYLDEAEAIAPEALEVPVARAALLFSAGRGEEALALLDQRLEKDNSFAARLARIKLLLQMERTPDALREFEALRSVASEGAGDEVYGQYLYDSGQIDAAIEIWSASAAAHPQNSSLARRLMRGLFRRNAEGDKPRAIELHRGLQRESPKDPELLRIQALLLIESGKAADVALGEKLLDQVVALDQTSRDAHLALIGLAVGRRDYSLARQRAIRAVGALPSDATMILAQADVERASGEPRQAREWVRSALAREPSRPDAVATLVDLALQSREETWLRDARETLDAALKNNPQDETLIVASARLHEAQGDLATGLAQLEQLMSASPQPAGVGVLLALSELLRLSGRLDESRARMEEAARLAPDNRSVLRFRLFWHAALGEHAAIFELVRQNRGQLNDPELLATACGALGASPDSTHRSAALALCQAATQLAPDWGLPYLRIGLLEYQANRLDEAEKAYRRALELDPLNGEALNNLAWILAEHRAQFTEAERLARKAATMNPENLDYQDTLARALVRLNRTGDALPILERCIRLAQSAPPAHARALLRWIATAHSQPQPPLAELRERLEQLAKLEQQHAVLNDADWAEFRALQEKISIPR